MYLLTCCTSCIELSCSDFVEPTNNSGTHFTRTGKLLLKTWTALCHSSHRRWKWWWRQKTREVQWYIIVCEYKNKKKLNGRSFPFNFSISRIRVYLAIVYIITYLYVLYHMFNVYNRSVKFCKINVIIVAV